MDIDVSLNYSPMHPGILKIGIKRVLLIIKAIFNNYTATKFNYAIECYSAYTLLYTHLFVVDFELACTPPVVSIRQSLV